MVLGATLRRLLCRGIFLQYWPSLALGAPSLPSAWQGDGLVIGGLNNGDTGLPNL